MNDIEVQCDLTENKTRVLVVSDHSIVRHGLIHLVNREFDIGVCAGAENTNQALEAIEKQRFELVIVDISPNSITGVQVIEGIRLGYPNLPILTVCIDNELFSAKQAFRIKTDHPVINQKATKQIITAIHYAQSLLRSSVFEFTVSVRIERSSNNGCGKLESTDCKISAGTK